MHLLDSLSNIPHTDTYRQQTPTTHRDPQTHTRTTPRQTYRHIHTAHTYTNTHNIHSGTNRHKHTHRQTHTPASLEPASLSALVSISLYLVDGGAPTAHLKSVLKRNSRQSRLPAPAARVSHGNSLKVTDTFSALFIRDVTELWM